MRRHFEREREKAEGKIPKMSDGTEKEDRECGLDAGKLLEKGRSI